MLEDKRTGTEGCRGSQRDGEEGPDFDRLGKGAERTGWREIVNMDDTKFCGCCDWSRFTW